MPQKIITKIRTSTAVKVAAVTAAMVLLVLASYGFATFRKIPTIQTPPKKVQAFNEMQKKPQNSPSFTLQQIKPLGLGVVSTDTPLYRFKMDYTNSPTSGKITFKQIAFEVIIPKNVKLSKFRFVSEDSEGKINENKDVSIKALDFTDFPNSLKKVMDIKKVIVDGKAMSEEYIAGFGVKPDRHRVYVTFQNELELPVFGGIYQLRAYIEAMDAPANSYISTYIIANAPMQPTASAPYTGDMGGYIQYTWDSSLLNTLISGNIFNIFRVNPPIGIDDPKYDDPYYFHVMPTIFSDNSSKNHNTAPAHEGGSSDWFPLVISATSQERMQKVSVEGY